MTILDWILNKPAIKDILEKIMKPEYGLQY